MNMDPFHKLRCLNSGEKYSLQFTAATWTDVADHFGQYLRGCGYCVTDRELSDYLALHASEEAAEE